ncbi:MAG TPA: DUF3553 domain-containing protein [Acetobacteraceae bacterium]|nr:DUF3553 domain-containing protein [Acetobacteraceae bacterium]
MDGRSEAARPEPGLAPTEPGQWVRHPGCPEWGIGQVQSVIGARITVNFEHAGKRLVNAAAAPLELVEPPL